MNRIKQILVGFFAVILIVANTFGVVLAQPSYQNVGNQTVLQNSGAVAQTVIAGWATNITAVTPQFNIASVNLNGSLQFEVGGDPAIDEVTGNLTFTLTPNTSGFATFNVELEDLNDGLTSGVSTIRLDVEFVNGAPTFNVDPVLLNLVYDEKSGPVVINGWATSISPDLNPVGNGQSLNFVTTIISQSPYISFNALPNVDNFGNLSFELTDKANGTVDLEIYLEDDGADSPPPNVNKSIIFNVTITINPINDKPTFLGGANIIVDEHYGVYNESWATNTSAGAPDEEVSQQLTFVLTLKETNGNITFIAPPSIDANGNISFEATPHYNGYVVYELILEDNGLNAPAPNINTSNIQAFTITVNYINDPPTYDRGLDITVAESDLITTFENWATNISPGLSPNEQSQVLNFTVNFVQVTGTLAFLVAPQITPDGTLTFRTTEHTHGEAIFDIFLTDDGELVLPHKNTSDVIQLIITITPVNFPPNDILLSNQSLLEQKNPGVEIGEFSTADLDPEDSHNYALVAGEGSEGNEFFTLDGNKLVSSTTFSWEEADIYSIRVKSSDGEFSIEKIFEISILKFIEGIKFANAITPNGDGQNDTWEIEDIDAFPDALVNIYDKAGLPVYRSSGGYTAWDGTTLNGKQLPMGSYYYIIDLRDGSPIYQGTLTIIL
ncbi:MAG: gliding motility-associated C-terminal domain-containing protein [Cyclobacteriaceae bacterium]|nr:gliding motility-associated C-terminal domain-containing protein [Cyclobacteriaceae bacterium]